MITADNTYTPKLFCGLEKVFLHLFHFLYSCKWCKNRANGSKRKQSALFGKFLGKIIAGGNHRLLSLTHPCARRSPAQIYDSRLPTTGADDADASHDKVSPGGKSIDLSPSSSSDVGGGVFMRKGKSVMRCEKFSANNTFSFHVCIFFPSTESFYLIMAVLLVNEVADFAAGDKVDGSDIRMYEKNREQRSIIHPLHTHIHKNECSLRW